MDKINAVLARLHGQRVYIDTNIFIYFLERHEHYFDAVVPFFQLFNAGLSLAYTGDAVVAEIMYKPYQSGDMERVNEFKAFFSNDEFITVLPHTTKAFEMAAELSPKRGMKLIDALHYATASLAGCTFILTNDVGFSSSRQIEVLQLQSLVT
ncbi:MAG: type II toxin-antitoxin system VapC family toxin [Arenimonas sp.]|nr:type II toxin-antitoxin system VapC family toxin [Arenimonas sp.]